jgi:hypothetical protein
VAETAAMILINEGKKLVPVKAKVAIIVSKFSKKTINQSIK